MSEKHEKPGMGRALVLAGVAAGAVVAACDIPVPTELGDAIEEVIPARAQETRDGAPSDGLGGSHLAKWFVSDPAPLVFVDGVRVKRYEDLPEPVRRWSESGLREEGLVESVEVMKGEVAEARYGEDGAAGSIQIFTKDQPPGTASVEPSANDPARPNQGNLWGDKFSGMAGSQPLPLVLVDGQRMPPPEVPPNLPPYQVGQSFFQDLAKLDIESFEIVKGAAATVLYGEEAAGGVIQIFTKNPGSRPVAPRI